MLAKDIADGLANQAENVCSYLMPNGKKKSGEWTCGDISGGAGDSLKIRLSGTKAGIWKDFADNSKGGDLLDLWRESRNITMSDAMKETCEYLGIEKTQFDGYKKKSYTKPAKPKCSKPINGVKSWLSSRGISENIITKYKIAEQGDSVVFPSMRDGELIRWKIRNKDDKHKCQTSSDSEPCLFGWQAISDSVRGVVICEGEIDALSWAEMGYPALSVPNGAQGHTWIENEYDNLDRFDRIFLSMDMDEAGQKSINEIIDRLGRERVHVVELPKKDANDVLLAKINVDEYIENAKTKDPAELKSAGDFTDDVISEFYPSDEYVDAVYPPWNKAKDKFCFIPAELAIFAGINGHGKTHMVGQMIIEAISQNKKVCIASMEMKPRRLLKWLVMQVAGLREKPSIEYIRKIQEWFEDKIWLFDLVGTAKTDRMLEVFNYARKRYGIEYFVVDSLLKCGIPETDYDGQKMFIETLCDFKNEHEVTIFLVAHTRKNEDETRPTGKMDIRGAGAITDLADIVLTVWRNKKKEEEVQGAESVNADISDEVTSKPDALLICSKNRNGEWEGKVPLWWHDGSHQYLGWKNDKPKAYYEISRTILGKVN